jgi:hypothetical protein
MAAPGSITGHVDDPDGVPIPGICVSAYAPDASPFNGPNVQTNEQGDYTITGLEPGTYKIVFFDLQPGCPTGEDVYLTQWFNAKPDTGTADLVDVTDGAVTSGIDATMAEPEAIAGRVTDSAGQPVYGICVSVVAAASPTSPPAGFAQTNLFGTYVVKVPAGQYKVHFFDQGSPCYLGQYVEQWYSDKPDAASADTVVIASGRTTFDVDAVMYEVASISGHVQDEGGQSLAGICIVANKPHVLNPPTLVPPFAQTGADGNYEMDIASGDWVLQFYDGGIPCTTNKYVLQYYNGKGVFDDADVIHVARGQHVTGINATMKLFVAPVQTTSPPPPPPPPPPAVKCRVPALKGVTLAKAKRLLKSNHCRLGKVKRRQAGRRKVGRVLASKPGPRTVKPEGTKVTLLVGKR